MPIGTGIIYNVGDLILSQVSGSGTAFLETKIAAATSSIVYFDSTARINSASLNSITVGTASYVSGSTSIITNLTASNISASGTGSFGMVGIGTTAPGALLEISSSTAASLLNVKGAGGNGILFVSGSGNVGIGTTSPNVKLVVYDNKDTSTWNSSASSVISNIYIHNYASAINKPAVIELVQNDHSVVRLVGYKPDATSYWLSNFGISVRKADTNMHQVFTAQYDGNIGIGITNPVAKLQVAGNISGSSFTSSISNAVGFLGTSSWAQNVVSASYALTSSFATTSQTANALNVANTYTIAGLTSAYVDVNGSGTIPTTGIYRPSTKTLGLSADGTLIFKISNVSSPATSSIETGNFLVSGSVGIGTSSPDTKLDVRGVVQSQSYPVVNTSGTGQWVKLGILTIPQSGYTAHIRAYIHAGYNALNSQDYYLDIFFKTSNASSVDANGFAGNSWYYTRGYTTSDPSPIWVGNAAGVSATAYDLYLSLPAFTNRSHYIVEIVEGVTWANVGSLGQTYPGAGSSTVCVSSLGFTLPIGNVGIGTSTLTTKFNVYDASSGNADEVFLGTIGTDQLVGGRTAGSFGIATKSTSNGNLIFTANNGMYFRTSGSNDRMFIKNDGNVGIGTTVPGSKLHVVGSSYISVSANTSNIKFEGGGGNGLAFGTIDVTSTYASWIQSGYVLNFGLATYNLLLQPLGGNVGIGTTSPSATLTVIASNNTGSRIQLGTVSTSTFMDANKVNDFIVLTAPYGSTPASVSNGGAKWGIKMNGSIDNINIKSKTAAIYAVSEEDSGGGAGYNRKVGLALHTSGFDLDNAERVRIDSSGNVGIGTVTPAAKLEISGSSNSVLLNIKSPISGAILYVSGSGAVGIGTSNVGAYTLQVNGSFAATTKSFVIEHPTKAGKKLIYGSLESPYHGIRLTGKDTLVNGKCKIQLPDYIYKLILHDSVNIQLTGIKCNKTLYIDDINVPENYFTIAYDKAIFESYKDYDFFWDFTAIRADVPELQTEM